MKRFTLTLLFALIGVVTILAQAPQAFKYQTVVRDSLGNVIADQLVSFRIGIMQDSINGNLVYSETHSSTTNQFGLVVLGIGTGAVETGVFDNINWGTAYHFLKIEFDETGGSNFQFMGTSQLLSVPYAINSGSLTLTDKNGNNYIVTVDTTGALHTTPVQTGEWTCGFNFIDERDSQSYGTVQIGTQCWMVENLNIGTMINGSSNQTDNGTIEKYCYGDNTANCDTYGGLYQWNEMMQYVTTEGVQGICPAGWHLPTDDEWKTMEMYLGMSQAQADASGWRGTDEGGKLKEACTIHWASPNTGATNSSGFSALPGGYRYTDGSFNTGGDYGYWWVSTESSGSNAYYRSLYYNNAQVYRYNNNSKSYGFGARCLRD